MRTNLPIMQYLFYICSKLQNPENKHEKIRSMFVGSVLSAASPLLSNHYKKDFIGATGKNKTRPKPSFIESSVTLV